MALQDLTEFADSLQSINRMKAELSEFNNKLGDVAERFNTATAVFTNVTKVL